MSSKRERELFRFDRIQSQKGKGQKDHLRNDEGHRERDKVNKSQSRFGQGSKEIEYMQGKKEMGWLRGDKRREKDHRGSRKVAVIQD